MKRPLLVLASQSPRRRELLGLLGLPFSTLAIPTPERLRKGLAPGRIAEALALEKAQAVASRLGSRRGAPNGWVLGADTLVWLGGRPLGKPKGPEDARRMLARLSGRGHEVFTGLALVPLGGGRPLLAFERTKVHFRALRPAEIRAYVESGGPLDKAGGYGIQEAAGCFVRRIEGCYFNVVGLPLSRLALMLEEAGLR